MNRDMKKWISDLIAAPRKKAIPVLSFPAIQLMDVTVRDLISSSDLQAEGMRRVAERVPSGASVSLMDLSVEAECFGSTVRFSDGEVPTVVGSVVKDEEGAREMKVPEVGAGRTGIYIEAIAKASRMITDRPVFAGVIGPYSLAGRLMDVTEIMYSCYDEPETVHAVLQKVTDFLTKLCLAYRDAGANGVVMAEPLAGLLSPALAAEFSCGYVQKIAEAVQNDSFIVVYHNCGNAVDKMIPEILATGCAAYHFGNAIDLRNVLPMIPADVPCMGNVDPAGQIRNGTPESVRRATLELMADLTKYPNYVISSGCDIPPLSPWANIDAFFKAASDFYDGAR